MTSTKFDDLERNNNNNLERNNNNNNMDYYETENNYGNKNNKDIDQYMVFRGILQWYIDKIGIDQNRKYNRYSRCQFGIFTIVTIWTNAIIWTSSWYLDFHNQRSQGVRMLTIFLYLNDMEAGVGQNLPI